MSEFISVIVTTSDNPQALDRCLDALSQQTDRNFEIVVADDGSGINTARVILDWVPRLAVPLKHAWHEPRGPRAGEIKNRGLRICAGDYCLFLDGDCVPRRGFVAAQRRYMRRGWFVVGSCVSLSRTLSERIAPGELDISGWGLSRWLTQCWLGQVDGIETLLVPPVLRAMRDPRAQHFAGSSIGSLACWRSDLDAVDGFESAVGDSHGADADICDRMGRHGVKRRNSGFNAAVFRLWALRSPENRSIADEPRNAAAAGSARVRARRGLSWVSSDIAAGRAKFADKQRACSCGQALSNTLD